MDGARTLPLAPARGAVAIAMVVLASAGATLAAAEPPPPDEPLHAA